jgi:hypothetical protein
MSKLRPRGSRRDSRIRQTCRRGERVVLGRRGALVRARDRAFVQARRQSSTDLFAASGRSDRSAEIRLARKGAHVSPKESPKSPWHLRGR